MALSYLIIREEYDNVAFIYVSDDMSWGTDQFKYIKDLHFVGGGQEMQENANRGIVDPDAAAYDLALMINCNHTIISRGTFTMWIALLAGGEYFTEYGPIIPSNRVFEGDNKT